MQQKFLFFLTTLLFYSSQIFAQNSKIKVACIGNSVTYRYGLKNPSTESYPCSVAKNVGRSIRKADDGLYGRIGGCKSYLPVTFGKSENEVSQNLKM